LKYLEGLYEKRDLWAHCFREQCEHHTNNVVESAFRKLKDLILHRTRAYNIAQLLDFLTVRQDLSYVSRYIDASNGSLTRSMPACPDNLIKVRKILLLFSELGSKWNNIRQLIFCEFAYFGRLTN
jgi:hypothetical protein